MNTTTATISNQDNVIDSRDVIARIEELEGQQCDVWVAGWNMPGYMPDGEPAEFDCFDDAKEYIADEMVRYADAMDDSDNEDDKLLGELLSDTIRADAVKVRALDAGDFGATLGGYHYWITQDTAHNLNIDEQEELKVLRALADDGESYSDWEYGSTLIRDSYFKDYAMELAEDCGMINMDCGWPNNCIDWDRAARELKYDYSSIEFDGVTYWIR